MKFYKYTPALLDPKTLEDTLIGRDLELNNLKRILKGASSGKSFSHPILVGPKGIGKTHILRIIYHAVKGEIKTKGLNVFKDKFVPVIFSEEEYPGSVTKLLILALRYLGESKPEGIPPIPTELMDAATLGAKEKELALSYIKTFKKKTGKMLLLLVDNLNDIIERFADEDQSSLREILMTYDSILLVGAAPTLFDSIINHDKPFYNFFEIIWLKDLSFEDTVLLLKRYAELEKKDGIIEELKGKEGKLRAIHELAGGNPRLILSLYHIIVEGDITSVEDTFLKLLDELSPYFRERMKDLSEQQKEIIDVMARAESLLTPTEIAGRSQMQVNLVNSQLKRLEKIGCVQVAKKHAKKVFYDFNERLFSLWRQMRVEAGRKRLGFIVKFLEIWFTKEELLKYLDKTLYEIRGKLSDEYEEVQTCLDKLWYIKESLPEFKGSNEFCIACKRRNYKVALGIIENKLRIKPTDITLLDAMGCMYIKLKRYNEALELYKNIIEIKPNDYHFWNKLGNTYVMLKKYNEAISACNKAIGIKPDGHEAWNKLGESYERLKKYDEAIKAYHKAVEIRPDLWDSWSSIGEIYINFSKYEEAIKACKKSIDVKPNDNPAWHVLGFALIGQKKYEDALQAFKKAAEIKDCKHCKQRAWLGNWSTHLALFVRDGIEGDVNSARHNLRESLNCLQFIEEKNEPFEGYTVAFKDIIRNKKIDLIKAALAEIERVNYPELREALSPYATLIKYLDTKDPEIIDRLRHEERVVVEDMLKMLGEKKEEKTLKKRKNGKKK